MHVTAEHKARDMLERMGVENAQSFSAGDLVELANMIAYSERASIEMTVRDDMGVTLKFNEACLVKPGDVFQCYRNSVISA